MVLCNNTHKKNELGIYTWQCENKFISKLIYLELKKYLFSDRELEPMFINKNKVKFNITDEEYLNVDVRRVMMVLPIGLLSSMSELGIDVPVFLSRKLIQMLKIFSSENSYDLDIFNQILLWNLINNVNSSNAVDNEELVRLEVEDYLQELGLDSKEDFCIAEEMFKSVFSNLGSLIDAEKNGEISLFNSCIDFNNLCNMDLKNVIIDLMKKGEPYNSNYFNKIFSDVGMSIPFCIMQYIKSGNKEFKFSLIEDYNSKNNGKTIISFPQQVLEM